VQLPDLLNRYGDILTYLGIDLVAIFVMTYVLYFRRHWRADLLLSYVALNVGIFVTMSLLTKVRVDIAVGFGLFAILSIIRLRSSAVTQQEVAYYFLALVLGLVNGMGVPDLGLVVGMNLVLLLTMLAVDSRLPRDRSRRMLIDVRLRPGEGVIEPPAEKPHHHHAEDGATPVPGSDPATSVATAGSSFGGRRDNDFRRRD
jgi:hypothetical protein